MRPSAQNYRDREYRVCNEGVLFGPAFSSMAAVRRWIAAQEGHALGQKVEVYRWNNRGRHTLPITRDGEILRYDLIAVLSIGRDAEGHPTVAYVDEYRYCYPSFDDWVPYFDLRGAR